MSLVLITLMINRTHQTKNVKFVISYYILEVDFGHLNLTKLGTFNIINYSY